MFYFNFCNVFIKNKFGSQIKKIRHFISNFCSFCIKSSSGSQIKKIRYFIFNVCLTKPLVLGVVISPYLINAPMLGIFLWTFSMFLKILFLRIKLCFRNYLDSSSYLNVRNIYFCSQSIVQTFLATPLSTELRRFLYQQEQFLFYLHQVYLFESPDS